MSAPIKAVAMRLDPELLARVDAVAVTLSRPGITVSRTDAVRVLLHEALAARDTGSTAAPSPAPRAAPARRAPPAPSSATLKGNIAPGDADYDRVRAALLVARAAAPREWTLPKIMERSQASRAEAARLSRGVACSRMTVDRLAKILPT
jgi:hypothetical protein